MLESCSFHLSVAHPVLKISQVKQMSLERFQITLFQEKKNRVEVLLSHS